MNKLAECRSRAAACETAFLAALLSLQRAASPDVVERYEAARVAVEAARAAVTAAERIYIVSLARDVGGASQGTRR